nr:hypothetical protein [Tanacetum cinerariifolium]
MRERKSFRFNKFMIHKSDVVEKTSKQHSIWQGTFEEVFDESDSFCQKEVIEFRDSYVVPKNGAATDSTSKRTATKKGRTVVVTTEDMQKRRNDVKARTTLLLALLDEHQLCFSKSDLDTMSLDDLYNHLKVYESEVQKKSESDSYNMAFNSSSKNSSRNEEVNTASIPTASTNVSPASANIRTASISFDTACAYIASQSNGADRFWKKTGKKISIQWTDVAGFDKSKVKCFNCHKMGHFARECRAPRSQDRGRRDNYRQWSKVEEQDLKALIAIDGVGWDWSFMANEEENHDLAADEEAPTEFALMAKTSAESEVFDNSLCSKTCKKNTDSLNSNIIELTDKLSDSENMLYHYKLGLSQVEARLVEFNNQEVKFYEKIRGLELKVEFKTETIECLTNKLELLKKEKEGLDSKLTGFQSASKDIDNLLESQRSDKNKEGLGYSAVLLLLLKPTPAVESNTDDLQNKNPSVTQTGSSDSTILSKPAIKFVKTVDRPTKNKTDKVEIVKKPVVQYAKLYKKTSKKSNVRGNQRNCNNLKSQQLGENFVMRNKACFNCGYFDHLSYDCGLWEKKGRVCPKNNYTHKSMQPKTASHKPNRSPMRPTRPNMNAVQPKWTSFYKPAHSYVKRPFQRRSTFGTKFQAPRVPTVNKKFSTVNRKFPTVNRKFPTDYEPFDGGYVSFSQGGCKITGKGTIKTECIVLGQNFKLTDNTNMLLMTPRQHSMYSIDLNNVVPNKDLTCLVAKASADECMLWHRRLGHLNIKTMNRLVRHNLVRGLPSKYFDNGHTCVACLKGKQHKASCKTKLVNSVTKPLSHFAYGLIWPYFYLKVKIIRCDNGGEFRNKEMNDFCLRKRIKKEFNNARTPQQNGLAKRRNRTLIEAARTMLADAKLPVTFWTEAVNTACYVQNRVLVNKSQNKTPYELFNGRTPAIGFLKPFGCHVMILNTLDHLEKFDAKGDKGTKEAAGQDVKKNVSSLRYISLPNWFHKAHLESSISNAPDTCNADAPKSNGNFNPTATLTNPSADHMETLAVETLIPTASSPVPNACLDDSPQLSSDSRFISKRVTSQDDTPSLDNILTLTNRFKDILGVTTNTDDSNGVEADLGNMENHISASPTLTFRIHKDHPKSQIIGPVDTPVQTRTKKQRGDFILVQVYVDDIIFRSLNLQLCREFEALMHEKFQMSAMGELNFFLGLQVLQKKDGIFLSQDNYVGDILKKFRYSDVRSANTLMDKENPWGKDRTEKDVDLHLYRSMIGSLIYLTASRPDIMFAIRACARHQVTPKECHLHAVKRIFRYLKGHPKLGLWYPKESPFDLVAYSDSDYGDDNVADLLTKPFDVGRFQYLVVEHTMRGLVSGNYIIYTAIIWSTARIETTDEGTKILATVDVFPSMEVSHPYHHAVFESKDDSTPRVTSLAADEGIMQQQLNELTNLCIRLQRKQDEMASKITAQDLEISQLKARVKLLEDREGGGIAQSGEDAPIKGRSLDKGEETAIERKEMVNVLTSLDAATVLSSGVSVIFVAEVPTGSGFIPTASLPGIRVPTGGISTGSDVIPTASLIFTTATMETPYTRRNGKEKMVESKTPKKRKLQEQMDVQMARQLEEEMERDAQRMNEQITRDDEIAKIHAEEELQIMIDGRDRNNETVAKFKRKGKRLEHDSAKKVKILEEVSEEDLKALMQLVPVKEVYMEALQVKHLIIDYEVHTEGQKSYWKIIRLGGSTTSYQFFVDLLKHFDREDLNQLWALVKETLNIRPAIKWRLYNTCRVHHVISKDQEMFMLVKKDYPLRKGLAIVMISYKIQVENYSQMANDLILKIHKIVNNGASSLGKDCWEYNAQGIPTASDEFPLPEEVPTASILPCLTPLPESPTREFESTSHQSPLSSGEASQRRLHIFNGTKLNTGFFTWKTGAETRRSNFALSFHVSYRDDLFLFARGDVASARVIMDSLDEFKAASGLVPSIPKSTDFFCNVAISTMMAILNIMPFLEGKLSVKYLGVPLILSRILNRDCKVLVESAKNRIGFHIKSVVAELTSNGDWIWPHVWLCKASNLNQIRVPILAANSQDATYWRDLNGKQSEFSVKCA